MWTMREFGSQPARLFHVQTARAATCVLATLFVIGGPWSVPYPASAGTVTHTYDVMDRLVTRADATGAVERFAYDGIGNLVRYTDRKGQSHTFAYDALNRLVEVTYGDGSTARFTYDAVGRLTEAADSIGGTIQNRYDQLGRLIAQTTGAGTVEYTYDQVGRRTSMTVPGQTLVAYTYNARSRLTQVSQGAQIVGLDYDAAGRRSRLRLPHDVSTEYQYDAAGRLTAMIFRNAAGIIGDLTYGYDSAGNRIVAGGSFARTGLPLAAFTGVYDAANRQLIFGDRQLAYDANGSVTSITESSGTTTFTWDARNRLVAMAGPRLTASFVYDVFGRRIRKTINGTTTQYVYDGFTVVQEIRDGVTANYLAGQVVDEPWIRNGNELYLADGLGSVIALIDPAGTVATRYIYGPFGTTSQELGASTNPQQYTARENDGTGLYYYRTRYYHPALKRFISEDPIGFVGGDPNFYAYVTNNPLRFTDPLGLINFLAGAGGSLVGATGAEGSAGFFFNPGGGTQQTDAGVFGSLGIGTGVNVGGDVFAGFVLGGTDAVGGTTINVNVTTGPLSFAFLFDPATAQFRGLTAGFGPSALPLQGSTTVSFTGTYSFRDFVKLLRKPQGSKSAR